MNDTRSPLGISASTLLWAVVAILVFGIVVLGVILMKHSEDEPETAPAKATPVRTMTVEASAITNFVHLPGKLEPFQSVTVAAQKPGRVVEMMAEEGDRVEAGQMLLSVDRDAWQTMLDRAEIEAREAEKAWRRWKGLAATGAVSSNDIDAVRTRHELAQVGLANARTELERCYVHSPVNGLVERKHIETGEYMHDGTPAFTIVVTDPVKLVLEVPEANILCLAAGKSVNFSVPTLEGRQFTGTVSFIAFAADRASNSYRTEALVPNVGETLKAGMIANAKLERMKVEEAIVVPFKAIVPDKGEHVAFVIEQDRAVRISLKLDAIFGDVAIVSEGINAGDMIVVEGQRTLEDGAVVSVVAEEENQP